MLICKKIMTTVIFTSNISSRDDIITKLLDEYSNENEMPKIYHYSDFEGTDLLAEQSSSIQISPLDLLRMYWMTDRITEKILYFVELFEKKTAKELEKIIKFNRYHNITSVIIIAAPHDISPITRMSVRRVYCTDVDNIYDRAIDTLFRRAKIYRQKG